MPKKNHKKASSLKSSLQNLNSESFLEEPHANVFAKTTIAVAAAAVVFFWVWAATTPVYEVVNGEGTVKPEGFIVTLEHMEGGRVNELHVTEGETVSQGDMIMSLDDAQLKAEVEKNQARAAHLQAQLDKFAVALSHDFVNSERNQLSNFGLPANLPPQIQFQIAQIEHLRATRDVDFTQLKSTQRQLGSLENERGILTKQTERIGRLMSDGRATLRSYEEAQIQRLKIEEQIEALSGQIAMQAAVIAQSRAKERELITGFIAEADQKSAEIRSELTYTNQIIKQVAQRLDSTQIRATHEGVVSNLGAHHAHEILAPGATVAEIVPQTRDVFAEVEVSAGQIGDVRMGSKAKLKIATHDYTRFGDVEAEVVSISPNSFENEDGSMYFKVSLKFDRNALNSDVAYMSQEQLRLITPGMTVTADIKTGRKTVLAYLIKPLRAISDRAFSES